MSVLDAAHTLGEVSRWRLTNLEMQKVLYIAQMLHLGRESEPLFRESFEAWEHGPVVPRLYRAAKSYGRKPIEKLPASASFDRDSSRRRAIEDAFVLTRHMSPGQLITYTHRTGGAWEAHFTPGPVSSIIPNSAILAEFNQHMRPSDDAVAWAEDMANRIAASPSRYLESSNERAFGARVLEARRH